MQMKLHDGDIEVNEGELAVILHGVEHLLLGVSEVRALMFEPSSTLNTGTTRGERRSMTGRTEPRPPVDWSAVEADGRSQVE